MSKQAPEDPSHSEHLVSHYPHFLLSSVIKKSRDTLKLPHEECPLISTNPRTTSLNIAKGNANTVILSLQQKATHTTCQGLTVYVLISFHPK
jgi:hypothetical protein